MKQFSQLTEREILALAIDAEDDDHRVYSAFAEDLRERYPSTAKMFAEMADIEQSHHDALLKTYREKFGKNMLPIRRADVSGFMKRRPVWLVRNLPLSQIRSEVELRENEAYNFYLKASAQAKDPAIKKLLADLAEIEKGHEAIAADVESRISDPARAPEGRRKPAAQLRSAICAAGARRTDGRFGLDPRAALRRSLRHPQQLVDFPRRPRGLDRRRDQHGLRRGALRRRRNQRARLALAARADLRRDDRARRPRPYTALSRPQFLPNAFAIATGISGVVVFFELWAIAWVRAHYMDTPLLQAIFQIVLGGVIVLLTGILIGNA